jgi:F0F1-type ATP synthase membrane subunit c/vacuolar-type H+-ATPase subunit K
MLNPLIVLFIILVVVLGPSAVIAAIGYATIKAIGRNPSSASKILFGTIIILIFVEILSIVALLIIFQLFGAK